MTDLYKDKEEGVTPPKKAGGSKKSDKPTKVEKTKKKITRVKEPEMVASAEAQAVEYLGDYKPEADTKGSNVPDEFIIDDDSEHFNIESDSIPSFEYGYKGEKPAGSYNVLESELFMKDRKIREVNPLWCMMSGSYRSVFESIMKSPSKLLSGEELTDDPARLYWQLYSNLAIATMGVPYDQYRFLQNDPTSKWYSGIQLANTKIRGIRSPNTSFDRAKISNKSARDVIKGVLNMGKTIDVFLMHSGFSVTLRPPTLAQFISVERKIAGDKLELGRKTRGLIASHDLNFAQRAIWDLFLECVESTGIGIMDKDFLESAVSILDLETIAWALACAKYPNGFLLNIPCLADPGKCNHVRHAVADLRKFWIVDNNKLTSRQREISAITNRTLTTDELDEYTSGLEYGEEEMIELPLTTDEVKIKIEFRSPNIRESFNSNTNWVAEMITSADTAFSSPLLGQTRTKYLLAQKHATNSMVYEHFVHRIIVENVETGDAVDLRDREDIREIIRSLPQNEAQYAAFMLGVQKYINRATIAIVALPNLPCPACGGVHETDDPLQANRTIIPVDVISAFLTLCQQLTQASRNEAEEVTKAMMRAGES